jgi:adenosylhomocysteine nucleosidase
MDDGSDARLPARTVPPDSGPELLVCALPAELGPFARELEQVGEFDWAGQLGGTPWHAAVVGVGKVAAASATAQRIERLAPRGLTMVGVCGGLDWTTRPGDLVHCARAVQADFALRSEREVEPDPGRTAALAAAAGSRAAWFLTADRPALSPWRRLRLARAYTEGQGPVADMETAAVAWVARRAGVPWSALRAVSDGLGWGRRSSFRANFGAQAGRAAEVVRDCL